MKHLIMPLFFALPIFSIGQNVVYKENGQKQKNVKETVELRLTPSSVPIDKNNPFDAVRANKINTLGLAPALEIAKEIFSFAYKIGTDILEARVKKFSGEYEKENSFIDCESGKMPQIQFIRELKGEKSSYNGLDFTLTPHRLNELNYFYYSVSEFKLLASKAKSTKRSSVFDYSIELQLTYIQDTVATTVTLPLIQLHSVGYNVDPFNSNDPLRFRTDLIPIPENAYVVKAGVKVTETNPQKVNAQRFLDIWNKAPDKYKESVDGLIAIVLKEES